MKNRFYTLGLSILCTSLVLTPAGAEPIAYISFDGGATSGPGTDAEWSEQKDTAFTRKAAHSAEGLEFSSLPTAGGSAKGHFFMNSLRLTEPASLDAGPVYVSFLFRVDSRDGDDPGKTREIVAGVVDNNEHFLVAGVTNGDSETLEIGSSLKGPGFPGAYKLGEIQPAQTILVVMKLSEAGAGAEVKTWFFPEGTGFPSDLESGDLPDGAISGTYQAPETRTVTGLRVIALGANVSFDEFRLGRTYQDVIGK